MTCAYCGTERAVNSDHVIPKYLAKRHPELPQELTATVPSCFPCNIRKGTRKLVPESWADKIPALKDAIPGSWRVWHGSTQEDSYREAWW